MTRERSQNLEMVVRKRYEDKKESSDADMEREDECGICLEPCSKMVLPNCCHAMCINCYRDWYELMNLPRHVLISFLVLCTCKMVKKETDTNPHLCK